MSTSTRTKAASDAWTPERQRQANRLLGPVVAADAALAEATTKRDEGIRAMLTDGASVADVAQAFAMTRSRVYQIRDGRRR